MWFQNSNYTWRRSDPDARPEQWADADSWQTHHSDLVWAGCSSSGLGSIWDDDSFSWDDEDKACLSFLGTAHDLVPTPDGGSMDWRPENGRQDASRREAATGCGVAAETMVSNDIEMIDASADPADIYAEEPEEMDWEPCHCTDADNDIVMRDMP